MSRPTTLSSLFLAFCLLAGCGRKEATPQQQSTPRPNPTARNPAPTPPLPPSTPPSAPASTPTTPLVPAAAAKPAILQFAQNGLIMRGPGTQMQLAGPDAQIKSISEPMEPDKTHAHLHSQTEPVTAYYVTVASSKGTKTYLIWVGPEKNQVTVQGYLSVEDLKAKAGQPGEVDRDWLSKHPPPQG